MKTYLLNSIEEVGPGKSQVLKSTGQAAKISGLLFPKKSPSICGELGIGVDWSVARLAGGHTSVIQDIDHELALGEVQAAQAAQAQAYAQAQALLQAQSGSSQAPGQWPAGVPGICSNPGGAPGSDTMKEGYWEK
jgi:hypothetical protein